MSKKILYLHGFASSPASWKVQLLASALAQRGLGERLHCPALSPVPVEAIAQADAIINQQGRELTLIGSSLGGFYASCLAERHGLRAVLINPLVGVPPLVEQFIGEQTNLYTGERFEFTHEYVAQLHALQAPRVTPENYLLMVETGDEVLDYRQALVRYDGCHLMLYEGGDHSFTHFAELLPQLLEYCGL